MINRAAQISFDSTASMRGGVRLFLFDTEVNVINGLTNYIIFRARNLHLSFTVGCLFPFMDVADADSSEPLVYSARE